MPRYCFHVFNDEQTVDEEGVELADQAAAMALAAAEARNLAAESVKIHSHLILRHRIEPPRTARSASSASAIPSG